MARIQLKRGLDTNLPNTSLLAGEPMVTTDRHNLEVATDATTRFPVTPAIDRLTTLAGVTGASDLIMVHDASEASNQMEKKITFDAFKTALNIPEGGSDELVAVITGGTAGYVWGTDGTDGIFRMGASMSWAKDAGNAFVTLNVDVVDGGTF